VSASDVPFCAEVREATTVVLSRCSASGRVCLIADSRAVGATYSIGCRARFCVLCSRGRRPPCLLRLLRTERHVGGTPDTVRVVRSWAIRPDAWRPGARGLGA
jgi:hypothetical protein